jgi:protein-disulfide isomerase
LHVLQVEPQLIANYVAPGHLSLAFSHTLDFGEPSLLASKTAECAGQQDPLAFWHMHELLFERQGDLWSATPAQLVGYAEELGLDGPQLQTCLDDPAIAQKIERMVDVRTSLNIRRRPSFDVNGQIVQGALPYTGFTQLLDAALAP